ncbi:gamma-glutamyl-gamma-aminobutyrate hydrolase family protein [Rheinheimera sp. UJ63]|uniref:gamma-glutamyl-gamma-aminobutyrate hydrolase family protein n=1 Tax=Rheinheimera sp. UJ63 TaxID=2910157 RepID=UPI001F15819C|nr:gamma-glutamyl-gamma-aminobutyrate hydrolase family protein [Rheinheimera sp. UJ63]MCF4007899.1 gamma-glutamyl-gamma-aminobutyrate hydrolase family protein [Rheinheimera sp. UJ63]
MMKNATKPLIAVTGPRKRFPIGWWAIRFNLWLVGLRGIYLYPGGPELNQPISGLIISGGDDIHPEHYGEGARETSRYDPARDKLEMTLLEQYLDSGLPILGICRGAQLLNIVANGSLHADIRPDRQKTPNAYTALPVKEVTVAQKSQLSHCVSPSRFSVNSLHNQAVKRLGDNLIITARDADGFVQAIEHKHRFVVGVQWHPEYLPYLPAQRELFRCFARAVKRFSKGNKAN